MSLRLFLFQPYVLSQVIWSPWAGLPPVVDSNLEVATLVTSGITHPFKGASLKALYLVEKVSCQLVDANAPQVSMDPSKFMLAPLSMTDDEYDMWRQGIPFAEQAMDELDYKEFNNTHLIPSLTTVVRVFSFLIFLLLFIFALLDIQMETLR